MLKNELEVKSVKGNENNIATLALRKFLERCRKKTGKHTRGGETRFRREKSHSEHNLKGHRDCTGNWPSSRNNND